MKNEPVCMSRLTHLFKGNDQCLCVTVWIERETEERANAEIKQDCKLLKAANIKHSNMNY